MQNNQTKIIFPVEFPNKNPNNKTIQIHPTHK